MKAVISSTGDSKYFFFIPIATWCWNKLGIDVLCFLPTNQGPQGGRELQLLDEMIDNTGLKLTVSFFNCPEYKEATYAHCSRLYAASLEMPNDEMLIISDVDMAVFEKPPTDYRYFNVLGYDLVPPKQYPMCYVSARSELWREYFVKDCRSLQQCLDDLLGNIECDSFRGNYWGKDQETLYSEIPHNSLLSTWPRAKYGTQFAKNRVDRDDANWRSYLGSDLVDAHLWRPGYTDQNFANIMELLTFQYPEENFQWLIDYRNAYIALL